MADAVVLDPSQVAVNRTEFALNTAAIRVAQEGLDWGDAAVEAYQAEAARGSSPVGFRVPNRQITIPILLGANNDDAAFAVARSGLAAKAALFQHEGGWLKRGTGFYADIVNATLKIPDKHGYEGYEADVVLTLEALPDFYSAETQSSLITEATNPELITTLAALAGNYPGRVRMVVTDTDARSRHGLIWALRSRHYSSALTAKCAYAAQALTPLDTAANATVSGQAAVRHQSLSTAWTPVLGTDITASGAMTHTGTNRIWALVYSTSGTPPQLRFVYDVGDMVLPEENAAVALPGASNWYFVDIGEARLDPSPLGTHRWRGQIQARGAAGGENVSIGRVYVLNVDEGYGVLRAPLNAEPGLATYSARDEFNQTAGALTGKTAAAGGAWIGAGDADDFTVETTGKTAQRTAVLDSGTNGGRYAVPGGMAAIAATVCRVDFKVTGNPVGGNNRVGLVARYTDINNWVRLLTYGYSRFLIELNVASTITTIVAQEVTRAESPRPDTWYSIALMVLANGTCIAFFGAQGGQLETVLVGKDAALATGGSRATGKAGIYDAFSEPGGVAATRNYDNFAAWVPDRDAVVNASQSAELTTDGMFRETADGVSGGQVSHVVDMLPRLPPAGLENRTCEVFLLPTDGDLDDLPHTPDDAGLSLRVHSRASYLFPTV